MVDAAKIVARAEFRVFGRGVIAIVKEQMWEAHAVLQGVRKLPPETYILSARSDAANVKLRDALLDVKLKTGETAEGFEIFEPRGKLAFPVGRAELAGVLSALGVSVDLAAESHSVEALLLIARHHPDLLPVTVEKTRYGFTVDGVICEYAEVRFNGALVESACCESADHAAIAKVVRALGLSGFENVSYLKAAKRIVGMT